MSGNRGMRGENRFYNPPPMRRLQQERERKKRLEEEEEEEEEKKMMMQRLEEEQERERRERERRVIVVQTGLTRTSAVADKKKKRASATAAVSSEECGSSDCSVSSRVGEYASNLERFLEYTTPVVPAQYFPRTSVKGWRTREPEYQPYFLLSDLWNSFEEWSAYGAGIPLLLNGRESVVQYYVPYLSGIQLYIDSSRPSTRLRRPGEESDAESSRDATSSDGSISEINIRSLSRLSLEDNNKPFVGSSSDESEITNSPGHLIFEYLEHDPPFGREPLADKIANLASRFPALRTYQSCDLSPSSWVSVAWYPIYRIPVGPTLQNLDACFLTFHCLSTGTSNEGPNSHSSCVRGFNNTNTPPLKLPLPTFGLASYKFKVSVWNPNEAREYQKANSLLQAADNWLRRLQVNHPDYTFFMTHNSQWR